MRAKLSSFKSRVSKWAVSLFVIMSVAAMCCLTCSATGEESSTVDMTSILQNSFSTMKSDIFGYIAIVLPLALAIVGAFFGIKKAISFFRSTASKG